MMPVWPRAGATAKSRPDDAGAVKRPKTLRRQFGKYHDGKKFHDSKKILNVAASRKFSRHRTIAEDAKEIWNAD